MKSVVFMHRYGPTFASYRYRAEIPAEILRSMGRTANLNDGEAEILVLSKPCDEDLVLAQQAKAEGSKIVVDICDDHFDSKPDLYNGVCEIADQIVCASEIMQHRIKGYTGKGAAVIPDPYEIAESPPHAEGNDLLWFGHQRNLKELESVWQILQDRKLRVVSGPKAIPNVIPWTPENIRAVLSQTNTVLLPVIKGREHRSANRLINALRSGCFAVCMGHPAFEIFRKFVWVGHFATGMRWLDANQHILNELVAEAQDYIRDRYSPETIGKTWQSLFDSI
jgi:hypothetical protein